MAESEGGNLKLYSGFHRKSEQLKEKRVKWSHLECLKTGLAA